MKYTRIITLVILGFVASGSHVRAEPEWSRMEEAARGQTVHFNAWGGSPSINDYLGWVAEELRDRHDIELVHVKLTDTADAVSSVLAEKAAGRDDGGTVDLIWINGENFARMKNAGLLFGPFVDRLPNAELIDQEDNQTAVIDFALPTDGFESPWGVSQFVMAYEADESLEAPGSMDEVLAWARQNPGRFTYPAPPNYIGTTFLKQWLYEIVEDDGLLLEPADPAQFATITKPLWHWLDALHPHLWRSGRAFPKSDVAQHQLLNDGEVAMTFAFNPGNIANMVETGRLPETVEIAIIDEGTIGNTHFVAIPYNATAKEAAMVTANFLLEPEAQARKEDAGVWGDQTVLDLDALDPEGQSFFADIEVHPLVPPPGSIRPILPEPHPSWHELLEAAWLERYRR